MYVETTSAYEADNIFEQICRLAQRLTLSERLRLIRDVSTLAPPQNEPQIEEHQAQSDEGEIDERQIRLQKLKDERFAWYTRPINERQLYTGRFVAVHKGDIVDSDTDKGALHLRVFQRFGEQTVLIISADQSEDRTIIIRRPSMADQLKRKR